MSEGRWSELADGVYARRYTELDLTVGLVHGDGACLVIDTRGDAGQGAELAAAVRELTAAPWTVAITHAHFDHSFGTDAFGPCPVWAHEGCRAELITNGEATRANWAARYRRDGRAEVAEALEATPIVAPDRLVADTAELSIGGRRVVLAHLGPAHTDHDLVVHVPDVGVAFTGDLTENGLGGTFTAESFGADARLRPWAVALGRLLELRPATVVSGHGDPVGPDATGFVRAQRDALTELARLRDEVSAGTRTVAEAVRAAPVPEAAATAALALP